MDLLKLDVNSEKMNEKYKITQLIYALKKVYNSNGWNVHNLGEGHIYLFYKNTEILRFKNRIPSIDAIIHFVILCIIDAPEKFGIKKVVCKLKKR